MKSQQAAPQKSGISLAWADHPYLQLGLIIVLGVGLRLFQLGTQSLWFDEAISYLAASLSPFEILQNPVQSSHPPLYYLALHSWRGIMPDTDAGVRALSVFWGTLLIPTSYLLAKTLFPQRNTAIVAAILVAVAPFQIIYSQELRMYTQVMVLVTCGVYAYWQGRQGRHGVWWAICFISFLCAAYTHSFSVLAISALGLHALVYRRQNISALWLIVTLGIITFLAMLPWFYGLLTESEKSLGSLRPLAQTMSRSVVKPLASLNFLLFGQSSGLWLGAIALFLTISLTIMSIIEVNKQWRIGQPEAISLLLLIIVCAFGIPITLYLIRPFFLPDRAFSIASPFLLILLAWGTTRRQSPLPYLVYATIPIMLLSSILFLTVAEGKPPYREVIAFVANNVQPHDVVLHTSDGSYLPAVRYEDMAHHYLLTGDPDPRKPDHVYQLLGGELHAGNNFSSEATRLWLVVALEHSITWQQAHSQNFQETYPLLEQHNFAGIQVYLFNLSYDDQEK